MTTEQELLQKNEMYDRTTGFVWQRVVYEGVHEGHEFVNIGGRRVLDAVGALAVKRNAINVLEFCCGLGATCRYLAAHFGLRVTGVDINARQIETAQANAANAGLDESVRPVYLAADVLRWQPPRLFDLVLAMDSLMLLPGLPRSLEKMRAVLKDGGCAVMAEIAAGPSITDELRQAVWDYDGIVSLHTAAEYERFLRAAGFPNVKGQDLSGVAVDCFVRMRAALYENKAEVIAATGEEGFEDWRQNTEFYLEGFQAGAFQYLYFEAV